MNKKVQVVFFGTPEFAVPTLQALIASDFCEVKLVVTQPDKAVGRHHSRLIPSDIKKVAEKNGIKVITPNRHPELVSGSVSGSKNQMLKQVQHDGADLGILVAYGNIIPKEIIDSFPLGILNLHPSLLPKYRGSSPIQAPILNMDDETGVTIMKLDDEMDHGPIVAQEKVKLDKTETAGELHDKLAKIGADLFIKILPDYIAGKIEPKEQDHAKATFTEKLSKENGKIDWSKTAQSIEPFIRAMNPWPGAWTTYKGKKLIIWKMNKNGTPAEIQLEGKKKMATEEFLRGHPDFSKDQLT